MAVITISREFSSGGGKRAETVAKELGYHFVDKQSIERILDQYGFVDFSKEYESPPGVWASFNSRIADMSGMLNLVTRAIARHGNSVILGRGSFAVLCGFADVLNVRIKAPFEFRVNRMMVENAVAERSQAEAMVREGDRIRSSFVRSMYGVHWDAFSSFDIVADIGKIAPDAAAAFITAAARGLEKHIPEGPRTSDIAANEILDGVVSKELDCTAAHAR
jgi:cytidylate kinase